MRIVSLRIIPFVVSLFILGAVDVHAGRLICPDNPEDLHAREAMATSSPEVKIRVETQKDSSKYPQIIKPLVVKAIKAAKEQRSKAIQEGIEQACEAPQQYVARLLPVPHRSSGCDHRIVTRIADPGHLWVQVVATCKYDWTCCMPEEAKATGGSVGFTLEGPVTGSVPSSTGTAKTKR